MYKVVGVDGREYGPVSAEQVRQWILERRLNAQSRVLPEGATEWKTLDQVPEFAKDLGVASAPAAPPVQLGMAEADAMANQILMRDYTVDIGSCLSRGWDLVVANFWLTVGASLVTLLLASAAASIVPFAGLVLNYVFYGGLYWMLLKMARGQKTEFADIFAGFNLAFVPLMLYSIVGQSLTLVGLMLCVLPGIYLAIVWLIFPAFLIMDKKFEFWPAMELSRKVVNLHWWQVFAFTLICCLVLLLGVIACCVGLFVALPITAAATVYLYEDIFGEKQQSLLAGPAPGPQETMGVQP